jgi:1-acyl-sn-glycerol-3-phosphate acyltransferase
MKQIRAYMRALAFVLASLILYATWFIGQTWVIRSELAARKWRHLMFRTWAKACAAILNMKVKVQGQHPVPPFLLVTNHLSYIDIVAYASVLDCMFVSKREVENWPLLGFMGQGIGTIFIDRRQPRDIPRAVGMIEQALHERRGVLLFAEGTSSKGAHVMPFCPSLLEPASKNRFPVSYATIHYRTPPDQQPAYLAVCWWGGKKFKEHLLNLFQVSGFEATITFGAETVQDSKRKALAKKLHSAVEKQFVPMIIEEE